MLPRRATPPTLPIELWQSIIGHLDRTTGHNCDLLNLCRVCHVLHDLVLPMVYSTLRITDPHRHAERTEGILRILQTRPQTREWVTSIYLRLVTGHRDQQFHQAVSDMFCTLPNLTTISITSSLISHAMLNHIFRAPRHVRLTLSNVKLDSTLVREGFTGYNPPKLIELSFDGCTIGSPGSQESRASSRAYTRMIQVMLRADTLDHISVGSEGMGYLYSALKSLSTQHPIVPLSVSSLTLNVDGWPEGFILNVLSRCPNLKSLTAEMRWTPESEVLATLQTPFAEIVPMLESLTGPHESVIRLVQGRPLRHIELTSSEYLFKFHEVLEQFARGSVPLRSLVVRRVKWQEDVVSQLARHFRALEKLVLVTDDDNYEVCPRLRVFFW